MFYLFIFILGAVIGSFLNVVIIRLHNGEKIANSRSHCMHCGHQLNVKDLIPLLSFIIGRGKCRYCGALISWQYPVVELVTGLLFVIITYSVIGFLDPAFLWWDFTTFLGWMRNLVFACILLIVFVYDFRWYLILDKVTIPAMVFAFLANIILGVTWQGMLLSAIIGLAFFLIQFLVSKGRWIGGGDLRLGFLMGLMLSWPNIIVGLMLSYFIGAIFGSGLLLFKKKKFNSQIPFGTFLAVGTLIAMLWGGDIISWYMGLV